VLDIINTFEKVNDIKIPYRIVGRREGDVEQVWADPTVANEILGWKAEETVEETLRSAWEWEKKIRAEN
jgi:UDP-glucose 4-epimerase